MDDTDTILIDEDGICWEWMRWLPGSVIARVGEVNEQQLRSVARCLGAVHRESSQSLTKKETIAFGRLSETRDTRMEDRVLRLRRVAKDGWSKAKAQGAKLAREVAQGLVPTQGSKLINDLKPEESFAFRGEVLRTKLEWIFNGIESRSVEWIRPLERLAERVDRNAASECSWGHGDAWRGNWLFDHQQVSGLIDFGQAGFRWKGFDFARLVGSLISDTNQLPSRSSASVSHAWDFAWEVYCGEHPTPGYRLEDAILMHRISTILTLELLLDRIDQSGVSRFDFDRLEEIVEMIEAML
jgi:Ser/Thr protein kinase RdoA (MazF antagonist)